MTAAAHMRRFARPRRGAVVVETAIVLMVLLTLLFALFDFGLAVLRHNALCDCARRAARLAALRGEKAADPAPSLGPAEFLGDAAAEHPLANVIRPRLFTMQPAEVTIRCTWPDGGLQIGQRVVVELTYPHDLMFSSLFGDDGWPLVATSTMPIEH